MKPCKVLPTLLVCRCAGAFVHILPTSSFSTSCHTLRYPCCSFGGDTSPRQHQLQHSRTSASFSAAARGTSRRRLRPYALSAAGGAGESGESVDGETEANVSSSANMSDMTQDQSAESGAVSGGIPASKDTGGHAEAESVSTPEQTSQTEENASKSEVEEEFGDSEQLFVPTGDMSDRRLYRAKLIAGSDDKWRDQLKRNVNEGQLRGQEAWAHELSAPEKGCLIVAKSSMFSLSQTYFNEAVIFLASHDENGSAGFILNRPTSVSLGDLVDGNALPEFGASPLYLGGDVGEGNVQIVHPFGPDQLAGAMPVIPGVYIGGAVDDANRMVATGKAKAEDFKFFLHLCGWAPGQLESEIERGVWLAAASSPNVVMKHCISLPVPMWREVMTLMGPKYGLLARDSYDDL